MLNIGLKKFSMTHIGGYTHVAYPRRGDIKAMIEMFFR